MTSKQRAYLRGLGATLDPIFQVGKAGVTPELTDNISASFNTRELIKIAVLKTCPDDPMNVADTIAGRTRSQVVQVIGRKIVLYKESNDDKKIILPV